MRPKVGLVLGGGGSRGAAHVGVLQVFVREGIPIDFIVGTSAGGIVGVLFALGYAPDRVARRLSGIQRNLLINVRCLTAHARQLALRKLLNEALHGKSFADLRLPVALMAVDMLRGTEVALTEGPLLPAVLATCATPPLFPLVELDGILLGDGGVIDSLATHVAFENGVEKVIAVDIYPPLEKDGPWIEPIRELTGIRLPFDRFRRRDAVKPPNAISATWQAARIMAWHVHAERLRTHPPDVLLRPLLEGGGTFDLRNLEGARLAGTAETERQLPGIRALMLQRP